MKNGSNDLSPLFDLYLRTTQKLAFSIHQTDTAKYRIELDNIDMALPVDITTDSGTSRRMVDKKGITVTSSIPPVLDKRTFYYKRVSYE